MIPALVEQLPRFKLRLMKNGELVEEGYRARRNLASGSRRDRPARGQPADPEWLIANG
jgi:hypothetical protein